MKNCFKKFTAVAIHVSAGLIACNAHAAEIRLNCVFERGANNDSSFVFLIDTANNTVSRNGTAGTGVYIDSSTIKFSFENDSGIWDNVINRVDGRMRVANTNKTANPDHMWLHLQCSKVTANAF